MMMSTGSGSGGGGGGGGDGWNWPPKSYLCSFCKREFRSAQALGGHMNVHRRDRALLKQVVISHNNITIDPPPTLPSPPSDYRLHNHNTHLRMSSSKHSHPRASVVPYDNSSPTRVSTTYYSQMSMGLDFSTRRYSKEERLSSKRCKKSGGDGEGFALLSFFDEIKCLNAKGNPNPQATKSLEGLDLELRLGIV